MPAKGGKQKRSAWLRRFAERQGWVCHICGLPIPRSWEVNSPLAPSRDHIIPRTYLTGEQPFNSKLAHRWCNSKRSCSPLTDQRRGAIRRGIEELIEREAA